jgi:hypothetical protein
MRFQRGVGHEGQLGEQRGILRGRDGRRRAGNRLGGERSGLFPLTQIASDGRTFDAKAAGNSGLGVAGLDSGDDSLAEISGIWFHTAMILLRQLPC